MVLEPRSTAKPKGRQAWPEKASHCCQILPLTLYSKIGRNMTGVKQNSAKDWLKQALEFENKGHDYYLKSAEQAGEQSIEELFTTLAAEEKKHIKTIEALYLQNEQNVNWPTSVDQNPTTSGLGNLMRKLVQANKANGGKSVTLSQAIDMAISMEAQAEDFYRQEMDKATCERERDFLKHLAAEENEHKLMLQDLKLYYEDPGALMEKYEHIGLDGA